MRFADGHGCQFHRSQLRTGNCRATIIAQVPEDSGSPVFNGTVALTFDRGARGARSSIEGNVVADVPFGRGLWVAGAEGVRVDADQFGGRDSKIDNNRYWTRWSWPHKWPFNHRHRENRLVIANWIPFDQCGHICFDCLRDAEHRSE
jgi:hypothetical protein